jgi:hypothetical protein
MGIKPVNAAARPCLAVSTLTCRPERSAAALPIAVPWAPVTIETTEPDAAYSFSPVSESSLACRIFRAVPLLASPVFLPHAKDVNAESPPSEPSTQL